MSRGVLVLVSPTRHTGKTQSMFSGINPLLQNQNLLNCLGILNIKLIVLHIQASCTTKKLLPDHNRSCLKDLKLTTDIYLTGFKSNTAEGFWVLYCVLRTSHPDIPSNVFSSEFKVSVLPLNYRQI